MSSAETQGGHILKTRGTVIRSAPDRDNLAFGISVRSVRAENLVHNSD